MKKTNLNQLTLLAVSAMILLNACKKDRLPAVDPQPSSTKGIYVLCEGSYSVTTASSNSSITYIDLSTSLPDKDFFKTQNGKDLGNNANDLKQYGGKMYCVITGSTPDKKDSYVEVMNIATGKSIKRIPFSDANGGFLPRFIAFNKGKAYVSGYDGYISRIDTASLAIEGRIKVGGALEGLAIVNNKLYVTSSAHFQYATDNNSSVSVVDLNTFTKSKEIEVGFNPTRIAATNAGDLFVVTKGDYGTKLATLDKLSSVTDTKTGSQQVALEYLNIINGVGFVTGPWGDEFLKTFNISNGMLNSNFVTDNTVVSTPYGININPLDKLTYVSDANGYSAAGKVVAFSADGKKKMEFATGSMPQSIVFNYTYK